MRKIDRLSISERTNSMLKKRQVDVDNQSDPKARARSLWCQRKNKAFDEIREVLSTMATGRSRCMYCEDNEGTDIEHYYPKSTFPQFSFVWSNYLLACSNCNSNYKRDQFPLTGDNNPTLINPTMDDPSEHLELMPSTGFFSSRSQRGELSIGIYGLNRKSLPTGRHDAWVTLCSLLPLYAERKESGKGDEAKKLRDTITRFPFSSVLWNLLRIAKMPGAKDVLPKDVCEAICSCPEICTW